MLPLTALAGPLALALLPAAAPQPLRRERTLPCQEDEDCSLNGQCIVGNGECMCYKGWIGQDCGTLDVLPVPAPRRGPPAVSYGTLASATTAGLSSWGGSLLKDPSQPSLYHLFASEVTLGCGLDAWYRNSAIVHATASSPLGPFTRREEILPAFAHEPVVVQLPQSQGGGFVMWKIGCADDAMTGSNGTKLRGRCTNCRNGTTLGEQCPAPDQSYERRCQEALFAEQLHGPWRRVNLTGFGSGQWDWSNLNLGLESHAPVVLANGSILTFTRAIHAPDPAPVSSIWLVSADSWNGSYRSAANLLPGVERGGTAFPMHSLEDSFMRAALHISDHPSHLVRLNHPPRVCRWVDPRGNYHALFHTWPGAEAISAHAYSRNGLNWDYADTPPCTPLCPHNHTPSPPPPHKKPRDVGVG